VIDVFSVGLDLCERAICRAFLFMPVAALGRAKCLNFKKKLNAFFFVLKV